MTITRENNILLLAFKQRETAGIRSSLIDRNGKFVDVTLIIKNEFSLHVLNYNSPGAADALPIAAIIVKELIEEGINDCR